MSVDPRLRKAVDWIVGLGLIGIGVVGGFIPLLPGWIAVLAGLAVLSSHSRYARALHDRMRSGVRRVRDRLKRGRSDEPPP